QADQGAAARGAWQRAWLWLAALFEPADGFAAWRLCGAADWLQLSRSVCGAGGFGLGSGGGGGAGRGGGGCGPGAFAPALGQCAHACWGAGSRADGALVVGACACDGGGGSRSGAALVCGAGGACWPCGFAWGGRSQPERSAVGGAHAGRDRSAGAPVPAD